MKSGDKNLLFAVFFFFVVVQINVQGDEAADNIPNKTKTKPLETPTAVAKNESRVPPLYKINITSSDGIIGQIKINITNGTEPVDVVHQFCLSHNLPLSKRREILKVICSTIACHRLRPILYTKEIYTNPSSSSSSSRNGERKLVGSVRIMEGQEPADIITKFYKSHDMELSNDDGQRQKDVEDVCKQITCSRLYPIVYTKTIVWDGQVLDDIQIMETQEPADAVHAFAEKFSLPLHVRSSMLNHACAKIKCSKRAPLKPGPMYSMEDAELKITAPKNNSLVLGPTLIVKYSLIVYNGDKFESQGHVVHSCFHVLNSMDEIISRNYEPGISCSKTYPPILYGIQDGEHTLEGWLTDTSDPTRLLTEKIRIKFRKMNLGSSSNSNTYPKNTKSEFISNEKEYKTGIQLSKKLQKVAKKTTIHDVLSSMLQAEWPKVIDRLQLSEAYTSDMVRMIEKPDLNNDMENIIRGAMHSFHLPLLVMTPVNTVWYKIENIDVLDLYGLKSLNGKKWMDDGAVNGCTAIEKNWHSIYEKYCRTERNSPTSAEEHKPSSVILSMVRTENIFNAMSRSAVIVGQSFDSFMSEMTVWDGNHRLVALFGKAYMKAKGLTCFSKKKKDNWVLKDSKLTLYIGLSKEFQLPNGVGSLFCRLNEQDDLQQRAPIDVSEYSRRGVHNKIANEHSGL